jgi:hypothetical protein
MSLSHTLKALALGCLVVVSSTAVYADNNATRSFVYPLDIQKLAFNQLKNACQPILHFVAVDGMKYPTVYVHDPRIFTINEYSLVTTDPENGHCDLIKKPYEYETMTVARYKGRFYNAGLQVDQRFQGSREPILGIIFEEVFRDVGLLSSKEYSGTLLVDEYKIGMPMRWSFSSPAYLTAVRRYLEHAFKAKKIAPSENKPLLKIELVKKQDAIDAIDLEFLNRYFTILDNNNPEVIAFFDKAHDEIKSALDLTKDAKTVGQKGFEKLFTDIEKEANDFDVEKLSLKAMKYFLISSIGGIILKKLWAEPKQELQTKIKEEFEKESVKNGTWQQWVANHKTELIVGSAVGVAGTVAAVLAYKAITKKMKKEATRRRRLAFEEECRFEHVQHDAAAQAAQAVTA